MAFFKSPSVKSGILSALVLLALQGCATLQPGPEQLQQRAEAYWKARLDGDLTNAFVYEELAGRKKQTLQQYVRANPPLYIKAKVIGARIDSPEKGVAITETEMRIPGLLSSKSLSRTIEDEWIRIDGEWYHAYIPALPGQTR